MCVKIESVEMPPKWTTLVYLICAIMINVHIYQICEEYLRYEITTNVLLASPEKIEFPSMTLCVNIPEALKWEEMSPELLKQLFIRGNRSRREYEFNVSKAQDMVNNSSLIPSALQNLSHLDYLFTMTYLYDDLTKEMTIPELLNMTHPFEKLFHTFALNGLFVNPNGSIRFYDMFMSNMSNFEFSIDKIYLHEGLKCFSLSLLTGRNNIVDFIDIQYLKPEDRHIVYWQTKSKQLTRFFLHKKGYLVSLKDRYRILRHDNVSTISYKVYESIRLEYPYKSNCRDYTKMGLLSRKECLEKCFKNKTVKRFGYVFFESHAFPADDLHLGIKGDTNFTHDIFHECKLDCKQIECYSLKHSIEDLKFKTEKLLHVEVVQKEETCLFLDVSKIPFTGTESQAAIPLITFVTGVLSTFGFWLGLSVSDSLHVFKKIWKKAQIERDRTPLRRRLTQQLTVNQRRLSLLRQLNVQRQVYFNLRRRYNTDQQIFRRTQGCSA